MREGGAGDPLIDTGGEHCSNSCSSRLWGENDFDGHTTCKNAIVGVNVYIMVHCDVNLC